MSWFRVLVRGENFRMNVSGTVATFGFYTTRFVEAEDTEAAEHAAIDVIKADPELKGAVLNDRASPPMIFVDEIEQVSQSAVSEAVRGFTFFVEEG